MNPLFPYYNVGQAIDESPVIPVMDRSGNLTGQWVGWSGWRAVVSPDVQAHHDFMEISIPNFLLVATPKRGPFTLLFKGTPYLPVPKARLTAVVPPGGPFRGQRFTALVSPESEGLWFD